MRKAVLFLTVLALTLGLCGCGSSSRGERDFDQEHVNRPPIDRDDEELVLDAGDADGIYEAVMDLIGIGAERGVIRMYDYQGSLEDDFAAAVLTAAGQNPIGAYCVYYIDYSLVDAPQGKEANVALMYRHSPQEAAQVVECDSVETLEQELLKAMSSRETVVTIYTANEDVDEAAISRAVESAYYEHPGSILYIPTYTVAAYPESGVEQILEVALTYPYATSTVESRGRTLRGRIAAILPGLRGETALEKAEAAARYVSENVAFDGSVDPGVDLARRYNAMTAYGALVQGRAAGEGFAMAVKVLCDGLGVECHVVRGTLNGREHTWNMVRPEDGAHYHLDPTLYDGEGTPFMNDGELAEAGYVWDTELYPPCDGPSMRSAPEGEEGESEIDPIKNFFGIGLTNGT